MRPSRIIAVVLVVIALAFELFALYLIHAIDKSRRRYDHRPAVMTAALVNHQWQAGDAHLGTERA